MTFPAPHPRARLIAGLVIAFFLLALVHLMWSQGPGLAR